MLDSDAARDRPSIKTHQTWPEVQNRRLPLSPPPRQCDADLPDRLWQSGKEMDGIRININPVNCLLRSPSLSCTLRVFYLPHLNILPKVSLTLPWYKSKKKFQLFSAKVWASGAMRKYWCQLPLQMPAGKKSPLDQTLNSGTLFFLLSFLHFSLQADITWMSSHTQQHHTLNPVPPRPNHTRWRVWLSETKLSHPADIRQSSGVKFISEAIALQASHLCLALVPTAGQDLPPMIGSSFIPKHSTSFPDNPPPALSEMNSR